MGNVIKNESQEEKKKNRKKGGEKYLPPSLCSFSTQLVLNPPPLPPFPFLPSFSLPPRHQPLSKTENQEWWVGHYEHVAHHHKTEDEVLHPMVRTRVAVMAEFETSHEELNNLLVVVDKAIRNRNFQTAAELAPVWHGYRTALYPHLVEEEHIMVPLIRAYFTPEEVNQRTTEMLRTMPKVALGSILHHLAGGKEGVMTFMARTGYRWHEWYTEVHAIRTHYREHMESKLESLLHGKVVLCKHKAEFTETHNLRPLNLNVRLVREPSDAADLAARITAELNTGRLSVQDALAEVSNVNAVAPRAVRPEYMQPSVAA